MQSQLTLESLIGPLKNLMPVYFRNLLSICCFACLVIQFTCSLKENLQGWVYNSVVEHKPPDSIPSIPKITLH